MEKIKINKMISIFSIQDRDLFTTLRLLFNPKESSPDREREAKRGIDHRAVSLFPPVP